MLSPEQSSKSTPIFYEKINPTVRRDCYNYLVNDFSHKFFHILILYCWSALIIGSCFLVSFEKNYLSQQNLLPVCKYFTQAEIFSEFQAEASQSDLTKLSKKHLMSAFFTIDAVSTEKYLRFRCPGKKFKKISSDWSFA